MRVLVHCSEARYLDNNITVIKELRDRNHDVTLWLHLHNLVANKGAEEKYRKMGFSTIAGKEMMEYDGKDAPYIIETLKPDILLPVEPSIYSWIKAHKNFRSKFPDIPVISIQNSFGGKTESEYSEMKRQGGWYVDYQCVWGSQQLARNRAGGLPENRMEITGNPAWDKYYDAKKEDQKYIYFIAGTVLDYLKDINITQLWKDFPNYSFWFKNHPNHIGFFERICSIKDKRVKIFYDTPIHKQMRCASVIVSSTSTCGIDAMLLDKPTIIINVGEHTAKFKECGRMINPKYEVFKRELELCLEGKEDRSKIPAFLDSVAHKNDGLATKRVVDFIEKIYKEKR